MPSHSESLRLKPGARRVWRREAILFFDALQVQVRAGWDLAYAWPRTLEDLQGLLGAGVLAWWTPRTGESLSERLGDCAAHYPDPQTRLWFAVLGELYRRGTALAPALHRIAQALREDQEREWQAHLRGLPLKVSLCLAFFFVLPALMLVFWPFLSAIALQ